MNELRATEPMSARGRVLLDPNQKHPRAQAFEEQLSSRVVGQDQAVRLLSDLYQVLLAGMNAPDRPVGTMLFLGPTGSGKTRTAEAVAEVLFGNRGAIMKIDCAEFQHAHEISKLIGSPPGYVGHRETAPLLTQQNLDRYHSPVAKISIVLFDEIEKASDALWQLLLGVLDRARLTLGDNRSVDFSRTLIVMTSNLGAREMAEVMSGRIGFAPPKSSGEVRTPAANDKLSRPAIEAAKRRFSPEFLNRIDKIVVFQPLKKEHLRLILDLELHAVQERLLRSIGTRFFLHCSEPATELLLREGTNVGYGARHLKRAVERLLVVPLSTLIATGQVRAGDVVDVDADQADAALVFSKRSVAAVVAEVPFSDAGVEQTVHSTFTNFIAATSVAKAMTELSARHV